MLWQAWSLSPDARQLGPRRSGRLVHPGRYAGAGRGGRSPPYGGRSHPVLVARGGCGCVSLALPSALFLSYGGGLGEPTTVYVLHTMAAQSWAPLGWGWSRCWLPLNKGCWPVLRKASRPGRCLGRRPAPRCSHLGSLMSSTSSTAWLEQMSHCRRSSHP